MINIREAEVEDAEKFLSMLKKLDNETKNKKELEKKVNKQKDNKKWVDNIICSIKRIMDV